MSKFSARIKDLRLSRGWSQGDLAEKMQVTKQTISGYERGLREPNFDDLLAIADICNVTTDYLLGNEDVVPRLVNSDEIMLIDAYRRASADIQCAIRRILNMPAMTAEDMEELNQIK